MVWRPSLLLLEQSLGDAELMRTALREINPAISTLTIVYSLADALQALVASRQGGRELPDLLVIGGRQPLHSESEIVQLIRKHPQSRSLVLAVLSSNEDPRLVADIRVQGAIPVLRRPEDWDGFLAAARWLDDLLFQAAAIHGRTPPRGLQILEDRSPPPGLAHPCRTQDQGIPARRGMGPKGPTGPHLLHQPTSCSSSCVICAASKYSRKRTAARPAEPTLLAGLRLLSDAATPARPRQPGGGYNGHMRPISRRLPSIGTSRAADPPPLQRYAQRRTPSGLLSIQDVRSLVR